MPIAAPISGAKNVGTIITHIGSHALSLILGQEHGSSYLKAMTGVREKELFFRETGSDMVVRNSTK